MIIVNMGGAITASAFKQTKNKGAAAIKDNFYAEFPKRAVET